MTADTIGEICRVLDGNALAIELAVRRNSAGGADADVGWGTNGDVPVAADYDGDGRADIAVFRPSDGVWYVQGGAATAWGASGDVPVPGDFNGDGEADIRCPAGERRLGTCGAGRSAWGTNGDVPLPLPAGVWQAV